MKGREERKEPRFPSRRSVASSASLFPPLVPFSSSFLFSIFLYPHLCLPLYFLPYILHSPLDLTCIVLRIMTPVSFSERDGERSCVSHFFQSKDCKLHRSSRPEKFNKSRKDNDDPRARHLHFFILFPAMQKSRRVRPSSLSTSRSLSRNLPSSFSPGPPSLLLLPYCRPPLFFFSVAFPLIEFGRRSGVERGKVVISLCFLPSFSQRFASKR